MNTLKAGGLNVVIQKYKSLLLVYAIAVFLQPISIIGGLEEKQQDQIPSDSGSMPRYRNPDSMPRYPSIYQNNFQEFPVPSAPPEELGQDELGCSSVPLVQGLKLTMSNLAVLASQHQTHPENLRHSIIGDAVTVSSGSPVGLLRSNSKGSSVLSGRGLSSISNVSQIKHVDSNYDLESASERAEVLSVLSGRGLSPISSASCVSQITHRGSTADLASATEETD